MCVRLVQTLIPLLTCVEMSFEIGITHVNIIKQKNKRMCKPKDSMLHIYLTLSV